MKEGDCLGERERNSSYGRLGSLSWGFATFVVRDIWCRNRQISARIVVIGFLVRIPFFEFFDSVLE